MKIIATRLTNPPPPSTKAVYVLPIVADRELVVVGRFRISQFSNRYRSVLFVTVVLYICRGYSRSVSK